MNIQFLSYEPDLAPKTSGLVVCNNLIPVHKRFEVLKSLAPFVPDTITGDTSGFRSLASFRADRETTRHFVGTGEHIWRLNADNTWEDVSKTNGYALSSGEIWDWASYGDSVIATSLADPVQIINPFYGNNATFGDLADGIPKFRTIAMYQDHLFGGYCNENDVDYPRRLWRSTKGDISDFSGVGAGYRDIPAWGEHIRVIRPLGDWLMVYMSNSVWAVSLIGAPLWFSYQCIHKYTMGPLSVHAIAAIDVNTHIYLGEDDVYINHLGVITAKGQHIRKSVISTIDLMNANRITHFVDPINKLVAWSIPTIGSNGTPDKILFYNWEEDRFSIGDCSCESLGTLYPYSAKMIDDEDTVINEDTRLINMFVASPGSGEPGALQTIDGAGALCSFSGPPLDSLVETGEITADMLKRVINFRVFLERLEGSVVGTLYHRLNDIDRYSILSATMTSNGIVNLRALSRYFKFGLFIKGNHGGLSGIKINDRVR